MRLVFDIETNGLYRQLTTIHCLVAKDLDTGEVHQFRPFEVEQGVRLLMQADLLIGHNIIAFDLPAIQKVYPWFSICPTKVKDTLVLSRMLFGNLSDRDFNSGFKLGKLIGSHSLEAWGIRLGFNKLDYKGGWDEFTEDMLEYNTVDVEVTERLWQHTQRQAISERASILEHKAAYICAAQERNGFSFDVEKAERLAARLMTKRQELEQTLQDTFKPFYMPNGLVKPKRTTAGGKFPGTWEGAPYTKIKLTTFNPGSRHHIAYWFKRQYGWKPYEFTDNGQPKIDEMILGKLSYPEAKLLAEYFTLQKRLGQLAEGDNAWLKLVEQGRLYGGINPCGAVTRRATHMEPNIGQVPAVGALYGSECRELFGPRKGWKQVGIDVSGLELRCLSHFLARWDGGSYGVIVCEGDVHWANVLSMGLTVVAEYDSHDMVLKVCRDGAKTFIYAFLYGAGNEKIGRTVFDIILKLKSLGLPYDSLLKKFFDGSENPNEALFKKAGGKLKKTFAAKTPGLDKLLEAVKTAAERGYLIALDGGQLHIRSSHAALNTLLQSAGALICKQWMIEVDEEIERRGWRELAHQMAWVHDELQFEVHPSIAEEFGSMAVECIVKAQEFFGIRVPMTGEFKIGNNWKECH